MDSIVPLIELHEVVKEYPAHPKPMRVLDKVNFTITAGNCAAIVGPSGCGKSTLLNLMGTLDTPDSGSIRIHGKDISALDNLGLARLRNKEIGFIFQMHHLLPQCTVLENVLIPSLPGNRGKSNEILERASHLLEQVGLQDRRNHRPGELSGGECQRTAVARALINEPALLLADEPTGALNEEAADSLADLLLELHRTRNMSIVVVTHAREIAQRFGETLALNHGHLGKVAP